MRARGEKNERRARADFILTALTRTSRLRWMQRDWRLDVPTKALTGGGKEMALLYVARIPLPKRSLEES